MDIMMNVPVAIQVVPVVIIMGLILACIYQRTKRQLKIEIKWIVIKQCIAGILTILIPMGWLLLSWQSWKELITLLIMMVVAAALLIVLYLIDDSVDAHARAKLAESAERTLRNAKIHQ
jgi:4-hydroxybenzoate polyprenyltransferase